MKCAHPDCGLPGNAAHAIHLPRSADVLHCCSARCRESLERFIARAEDVRLRDHRPDQMPRNPRIIRKW